jgi:hypothetical protein
VPHGFLPVLKWRALRKGDLGAVASAVVERSWYYCFEAWHLKWFERCSQAKAGSIDHARALLISVFLDLNSCVRRASFFLPVYETKWGILSQVLERFTKELERTCYVLASGVENEEGTSLGSGCSSDRDVAEVRFKRTVCRARKLWESRPVAAPIISSLRCVGELSNFSNYT